MGNFTFKTPTSIGHISGLTEKQVKALQANQEEEDDNTDITDEEEAVYPTGIAEGMEEAKNIHDKHYPAADDINDEDDALYPVEVSEHLKLKDADILKRDYAEGEEGMYPINVTE